jgi:predicted Zn-dependent protease
LSAEPLAEALASLVAAGLDVAEVYWKRGRSRRLELESGEWRWSSAQEEGWAVRAGNRQGAFFCAGTGEPRTDFPWPRPSAGALRLPEPLPLEAGEAEAAPEAPLLGESEGRALLESVGRDLATELAGARLLRATLEEGTSESELRNSNGIDARWRSRAAILRLEAGAGSGGEAVAVDLSERQAAAFRPASVARRLADRLLVSQSGAAPERDRGEFLLSPSVGARLLEGLLPFLVGPRAAARSAPLRDPRGRIGARALTVIDDGRLRGGGLSAPYDGEGVPTREVLLVEEGVYRQPLVSWRDARPPEIGASGCTRRASWRDVPTAGPTQLYIRPQPQTAVATLLGAVARGYYLLDVTGPGRFDGDGERFALPVCGFAVASGRASAPVARAWLCGSWAGFLRGVEGAARDLVFLPLDGLLGSPTLLATGLEIRPAPLF